MSHEKHITHLAERMRRHGWSEDDIDKMSELMRKESKHHFIENKFHEVLHWIVFMIIVAVNFFASALLIPLLVVFPNPGLYAVLMISGACFGLLYAVLLSDISHMFSKYHHLAAGFIIPVLAAINIFFIVTYFDFRYSNVYGEIRYPATMALFYAVAFILPYLMMLLIKHLERSSREKV